MTSWSSGDPCWIVVIFDPEARVEAVSVPLIERELGISRREAELTAVLVSGARLSSVAQHMGISIHTARSQLKSVFRKTGVSSQAELLSQPLHALRRDP